MSKKVYTIIITPSTLEPSIKFTLHRSTILLIVITLIILISYGILGSLKFYEENKLYIKYIRIKKEKEELEKANKILPKIREKENLIRNFLGLDQDHDKTGEPGQGGPGIEGLGIEDIRSNKKLSSISHYNFKSKKLAPTKEAILLNSDLQEIIDFLEDQKTELASLPTISPISASDAWISSRFGNRISPFTGLREFHSGLDISAARGTPILATGDGIVSFVGRKGALGKTVKIKHNRHYETIYGHLLKYNVKVGQKVKRGDVIGFVGMTGRTTGYHVHYEIRKDKKPINPYPYILNWKGKQLFASKISPLKY